MKKLIVKWLLRYINREIEKHCDERLDEIDKILNESTQYRHLHIQKLIDQTFIDEKYRQNLLKTITSTDISDEFLLKIIQKINEKQLIKG